MALLQRLKAILGLDSTQNREYEETVEVDFDPGTAEDDATTAPAASTTDEGSAATEAGGDSDPVDVIDGIGPAYSDRLAAAGIETVADLAAADPDAVAEDTDVSPSRVEGWIDRANDRA